MRVVSYRLNRVTPAGALVPVYELTVDDAHQVTLPAEAWAHIAASVKDDVEAMAAGYCIATAHPEPLTVVKG